MPNKNDIPPIQDLVDFYLRWPQLRQQMIDLAEDERLDTNESTILSWMIKLVNRVGSDDLTPPTD